MNLTNSKGWSVCPENVQKDIKKCCYVWFVSILRQRYRNLYKHVFRRSMNQYEL